MVHRIWVGLWCGEPDSSSGLFCTSRLPFVAEHGPSSASPTASNQIDPTTASTSGKQSSAVEHQQEEDCFSISPFWRGAGLTSSSGRHVQYCSLSLPEQFVACLWDHDTPVAACVFDSSRARSAGLPLNRTFRNLCGDPTSPGLPAISQGHRYISFFICHDVALYGAQHRPSVVHTPVTPACEHRSHWHAIRQRKHRRRS